MFSCCPLAAAQNGRTCDSIIRKCALFIISDVSPCSIFHIFYSSSDTVWCVHCIPFQVAAHTLHAPLKIVQRKKMQRKKNIWPSLRPLQYSMHGLGHFACTTCAFVILGAFVACTLHDEKNSQRALGARTPKKKTTNKNILPNEFHFFTFARQKLSKKNEFSLFRLFLCANCIRILPARDWTKKICESNFILEAKVETENCSNVPSCWGRNSSIRLRSIYSSEWAQLTTGQSIRILERNMVHRFPIFMEHISAAEHLSPSSVGFPGRYNLLEILRGTYIV